MSTLVQDDLTKIQDRLQDGATIWTQAELLRAYNDAYRQFLSRTRCVKQHECFDVPPRNTVTYCYEWEDTAVKGQNWMCMLPMRNSTWRGTTRWEAQQAENVVTLTAQSTGITQQWERSYAGGDVDRNYDLVFPLDQSAPNRVRFNNTIMLPITTLELDQVHISWPTYVGQPYWWTAGLGRIKSIEIYRIQTDYNQAYQLTYPLSTDAFGMPRYWTGSRTYGPAYASTAPGNGYAYTSSGDSQAIAGSSTSFGLTGMGWRVTQYQATDTGTSFCTQSWEADTLNVATTISTGATVGTYWHETDGKIGPLAGITTLLQFATGAVRSLDSTARQYFALPRGHGVAALLGTIRDWDSSDGNFFVTYTATPQSDLTLLDNPDLIPVQMQKYLRFYVLAQAYGRIGEGYRPDLAQHYLQRFDQGVHVMRKLNDVAFQDRIYVREEVGVSEMRRVPLVQLPPQYERIW